MFVVMRTVFDIPHPRFKITVFIWNEKYLVEIETGPFKQTYKIPVESVTSEDDVRKIFSPEFLEKCEKTFEQMYDDFSTSVKEVIQVT